MSNRMTWLDWLDYFLEKIGLMRKSKAEAIMDYMAESIKELGG